MALAPPYISPSYVMYVSADEKCAESAVLYLHYILNSSHIFAAATNIRCCY